MERSELRARPDPGHGGSPSAKKVSREQFLQAWKRESDECVGSIFSSLPIDGPVVSGALKEAAIEDVMRTVWARIDAPDGALWANREAIREYTSALVDKAAAERWARVAGGRDGSEARL